MLHFLHRSAAVAGLFDRPIWMDRQPSRAAAQIMASPMIQQEKKKIQINKPKNRRRKDR